MTFPKIVGFCLLSFLLINFSYAKNTLKDKDNLSAIIQSVERLCKAPTEKKSTHYKVEVKGKLDIRVRIIGLLGANALFTKEEYTGFQRVLKKHQVKDNKDFRACSMALTPLFIEKFYHKIKENASAPKADKPKINVPTQVVEPKVTLETKNKGESSSVQPIFISSTVSGDVKNIGVINAEVVNF